MVHFNLNVIELTTLLSLSCYVIAKSRYCNCKACIAVPLILLTPTLFDAILVNVHRHRLEVPL